MKTVGIIPVRENSSRLPGKALELIENIPAIVHVYKRASLSKELNELYVATDSLKICKIIEQNGGKFILTGQHKNGSERIFEASKQIEADIIINIQGDEVLVDPTHIDLLAQKMKSDSSIVYSMGVTEFSKINSSHDFKVVLSINDNVIYCSRSDIPSSSISKDNNRLKAVFIFGFTKNSLSDFVKMKQTSNEMREPNEFLRIIDNELKIKAVRMPGAFISLDTYQDLVKIKKIIKKDKYLSLYALREF